MRNPLAKWLDIVVLPYQLTFSWANGVYFCLQQVPSIRYSCRLASSTLSQCLIHQFIIKFTSTTPCRIRSFITLYGLNNVKRKWRKKLHINKSWFLMLKHKTINTGIKIRIFINRWVFFYYKAFLSSYRYAHNISMRII